MTVSDTPSLVLRNTSLTMRQRFTPARSCSTWTRICANFRLIRFAASVSFPRGGFFFRLAGFRHLTKGLALLETLEESRSRDDGELQILTTLAPASIAAR